MKRLFLYMGIIGGTLAIDSQAMINNSSTEGVNSHKTVRKIRPEALKFCVERADPEKVKRMREERLQNLASRLFYGDINEIPAIYTAVIKKDLRELYRLFTLGVDMNTEDHHQRTPLILALMMQNLKDGPEISRIVEWLIVNSSDVNVQDDSGRSSLHYAATYGKVSVLAALLVGKADVNQKDKLGRGPIFGVASNGNVVATKYLIYKGANPKVRDNYGRTPIFYAATNGFLNVVKLLLAYDNPNVKDNFGRSLISYAVESGNIDLVDLLSAQGADLSVKDNSGRSLISYAIERGDLDMVEWLRSKGADLSVKDNSGRELIFYAAMGGHVDAIEYLFKEGAELNMFDENERTPLFYSIMYGHLAASKWLHQHDCALNERDRFGKSVLHYLAEDGININLMDWLLKSFFAINVDLVDNDGKTPLHYAAEFGDDSCVKFLVDHGAKMDVIDGEGRSPVYHSIMKRDAVSASFLIKKGASIGNIFHMAMINRDVELAKFLIRCKADPNVPDENQGTPMIYAVLQELYPIVGMFAVGGIQDESGKTVFHLAANFGKHNLMEKLIQNGVATGIDTPDDFGRTPLHYAARSGHANSMLCLLRYGVDINPLDFKKATPLSYVPKDAKALRQYLIEKGAH